MHIYRRYVIRIVSSPAVLCETFMQRMLICDYLWIHELEHEEKVMFDTTGDKYLFCKTLLHSSCLRERFNKLINLSFLLFSLLTPM